MRRICVIFFNKNKDVDLTTKELQSHDECYQTFTRGFSVVKVSSQSHVAIRLKNKKCFSGRKNLIQTMKITWSKP